MSRNRDFHEKNNNDFDDEGNITFSHPSPHNEDGLIFSWVRNMGKKGAYKMIKSATPEGKVTLLTQTYGEQMYFFIIMKYTV